MACLLVNNETGQDEARARQVESDALSREAAAAATPTAAVRPLCSCSFSPLSDPPSLKFHQLKIVKAFRCPGIQKLPPGRPPPSNTAITFPHQIHCDVLDAINYPM